MAVLDPIHWEAVTPQVHDLMRLIGRQPFAARFYLAGGTALALRVGHRRSIDLDFFSTLDEVLEGTRHEILDALSPSAPLSLEEVDGNLLLRVLDLHVGFFSYSYSLIGPTDSVEGVEVASLTDVGLMKLDALIGRGSRKDFYDVYTIAHCIPIPNLLALTEIKYPRARDFQLMAAESMVSFENADEDLQPDLLIDVPWEQVKRFFIAQARSLGEMWLGDQQETRPQSSN
jgi:hypothetical protein